MSSTLLLKPHISEKSYQMSENGVYVFVVPVAANKDQVRQAVEIQFSVSVTKVRSHRIKGKTKRSAIKRAQPISGKRADTKRMYVSLKDGDTISVFEGAS